ncbi:M13 family metallopeptidase [Brevundimonas terrae]|uniref:M13 family metallopeptidase n=1 Tax=Brevundimonas terrae TaxID=363631 RepID=A0ABP3ICD8_9CAUL|nr:M13-type metalloendopeptidase [Brevundimonas terrae]NIJ27094.1 putative endopeptidase [Brevundimonas terrae]
MKKHLLCAVALSACLTAPCVASAQSAHFQPWGFDLEGRDLSVRPGDDFNAYANGTYLANVEIPADKTRFGPFDALYENAQGQLRAIIEESAANPNTDNARKVGALYASFMNEAAVDAKGAAPMAADLASVKAATSHSDIARLMGGSNDGFGSSIFGLGVMEDMKNSSINSLYLGIGSLGLPDRDYYLSDSFAPQRAAYQAYIGRMLTMAGWDNAEQAASDIMAFETALAQKHWPIADRRQFDKLYNPIAATELSTFAPGFDWAAFLNASKVGDVAQVVMMENTALPGMAEVFAATDLNTLKAWQAFNIIDGASPYLSKDFVDARFEFRNKTLRGQPENRPRWNRGVALVDGSLSEVLGQEYVARHFPASSKAQMEELVGNLIATMRDRLTHLEWMAPATRTEALAKLDSFRPKIGYPDKWRSYDALNVSADDLYGNIERISAFDWAYNRAKIGQAVDLEEWGMSPQTVNAYYHPLRNEIVFPAAILQPPFFDPNADAAVNYGGIGAVIGHEIMHGFDDQGRKTDAKGQLRDWWTAEDAARFDVEAKKLGALYAAQQPLPGVAINPDLTMGENIADLGGLVLAHAAYNRSLNGQAAPVMDGVTAEQRLFLGWAQVWRDKIRDETLREYLATDPHSPGAARAATPPRSIDAWYDAFGITADQKQYLKPEDRVRIW